MNSSHALLPSLGRQKILFLVGSTIAEDTKHDHLMDSLVTWVGINDLAYQTVDLCFITNAEPCYRYTSDSAPKLQQLFELQGHLYERGARNFCYIDVPPMDRSPACRFIFPYYIFFDSLSMFQMIDPCFQAGRKNS